MIVWLPEDPPVQRSKCGRYSVVHATEDYWVAYHYPHPKATMWREVGTFRSPEDGRAACEAAERSAA